MTEIEAFIVEELLNGYTCTELCAAHCHMTHHGDIIHGAFLAGMMDTVASTLNKFFHASVQLSPRDQESAQPFIAEFFYKPCQRQ